MTPPVRTQRADAARNRASLLAAAEKVFAEKGHAASVADIAAAAGVAKGHECLGGLHQFHYSRIQEVISPAK